MKKPSFAGLILFLAFTAGACVYSDSGIYTVDPVPGEKAIDSITTNLDTITRPVVSDSLDLDIQYRMTVRGGEPYYVDCWLADFSVYELRLIYDQDDILIYLWDTVFTVEADTTIQVVDSDTVLMFVRDTLTESYTLDGSFSLQSTLPVTAGEHLLQMFFYYSANTNSLADILRREAQVTEREYAIIFEAGGIK